MQKKSHVKFIKNQHKKSSLDDFPINEKEAKNCLNYHKSFPQYSPTPLIELKNLAKKFGVKTIYVKDESSRFNLNAFKVLGSSYAIGKYIAQKLNMDISELTFAKLSSNEIRNKLGNVTFVTATDGNHGRGVAWTAKQLQQHCVVYLPKGSSEERLNNILSLGAEAFITDLNYDDTVRFAAEQAKRHNWVLLQDTSWPEYETIPLWIMQGYLTLMEESIQQLNNVVPTHIFLQAGVGAMAGAISNFIASHYCEHKPTIVIVESNQADCIFQTASANDGKIHAVTGSLSTIMAGLACGEPCTIGWNILKEHADYFLSIPDTFAALGMRILANPLEDDSKIVSGESGAVTLGAAIEILKTNDYSSIKKDLQLDEHSIIFCISTEGDTDPKNYLQIVWDGQFCSE